MGRESKLSAAGINIVVHPHDPNIYIDFVMSMVNLASPVRISGDTYLLLFRVRKVKDKRSKKVLRLEGDIARFTHIDRNSTWINTREMRAAKRAEMREVNIPDDLDPNMRTFSFVFLPDAHKFVFESYGGGHNLSPNWVRKFLRALADRPKIKKRFDQVSFTVIPDKASIDKILAKKITHLKIVLRRPNPDSIDEDLWASIEKKFKDQNISHTETTYHPDQSGIIDPDDETKAIAEVAAENGQVDAKYHDQSGFSQRISTTDQPRIETSSYDAQKVTRYSVFEKLVGKFK